MERSERNEQNRKQYIKWLKFGLIAVMLPVFLCTATDRREEAAEEKVTESVTYHLFEDTVEETVPLTEADDEYFSKQWALYNDGSFSYQNGGQTTPGGFPISQFPGWGFPGGNPWDWSRGNTDGGWDFWKHSFYYTSGMTEAAAGIDIGMKEAWSLYNGGVREVIVAVIDTGIDGTHEDLKGVLWVNEDEIAGDGIDNDGNGYIDDVNGWNFYSDSNEIYVGTEDDHGTHGAGTIAAELNELGIAGIAGNSTVRIMSLKALGGSEGSGSTESVIEAIQYAEANGAVICNLSFGTTSVDSRLEKVMRESDMLFVAAAGNGDDTGAGYSLENTPIYPAAYDLDNLISVANLQCDGTLNASSNYGEVSVDLAAPGTYILSTVTGSKYSYMTGTSMSAPMVTAVAALLYSQYEDISLAGVKEILLNSTASLDALEGKVATGGMLNAAAALQYDVTQLAEYQTGNAPTISARVYEKNGTLLLKVTILDEDGDLTDVRYRTGTRTAEDFAGGTKGKAFTLNSSGRKNFYPKAGQTYTFYARDEKGNETVYTVKAVTE